MRMIQEEYDLKNNIFEDAYSETINEMTLINMKSKYKEMARKIAFKILYNVTKNNLPFILNQAKRQGNLFETRKDDKIYYQLIWGRCECVIYV